MGVENLHLTDLEHSINSEKEDPGSEKSALKNDSWSQALKMIVCWMSKLRYQVS